MRQKEKEIRRQLIIEGGKYVLDLTKLVFAGIVLAGIFNLSFERIYLIIAGLLVVAILTIFGFLLMYKGNKYKDNK